MGLTFLLGLCQFVTEGCIFVRHIKFQHIISSPRRGHCWFRNKQRLWDLLKSMDSQYASLAEVFYGAIYWSPIITSKNWSEFLSNQNKHLCFFCFQDKIWNKMPQWTIFFNIIRRVCFDCWEFLTNFLTYFLTTPFDSVQNSSL